MKPILERKIDHIEICLRQDVEGRRGTGFGRYYFLHQALPEISLADVRLETTFLGRRVAAPILISGMTGGPELGAEINRNLAAAAQELGLPISVGSQRAALRHPETRSSFTVVREQAPDVPVFANLGAADLGVHFDAAQVADAVHMLDADGLFLHLNPLQEVIQGDRTAGFRGLAARLRQLAREADFPVLAKEVGCGISPQTARLLADCGVAAIDVSGVGGTSWAKIEALRSIDESQRRLGASFQDWGIPTEESLILCRAELPDLPLIASGGVRNGIDSAKALALSANLVAMALPLLAPATRSARAVVEVLRQHMEELRLAMFLIGAPDVETLRASRHLLAEVR
ncbi:MAG: type 2 isopentenyl-diphosphate Delta-isomerase [Thermaerobacter sp.]|nr:type 2 isopentenyl-diphosphate Delta-isomerase [Thermaerobacter sp.]